MTIMSEEDEEGKRHNADYGYPLQHMVKTSATYDSGIAWPKLLERTCEAIGAYYGYDVKDKVFVKQFGKIVNIFGHDDPVNYETDSDADANPAT
jgi:hypothetical protein